MAIDVGDLLVTIRGDVGPLQSALNGASASATNFQNTVQGVGTQTETVAKSFGGLVREGPMAERALQRIEFAMFNMAGAGNLSATGLMQLSFGFARLLPAALPIIGIFATIYEVVHHVSQALEEQQKAADTTAESNRKALEKLATPLATYQRSVEQRLVSVRANIQADTEQIATLQRSIEQLKQHGREALRDATLVAFGTNLTADAHDRLNKLLIERNTLTRVLRQTQKALSEEGDKTATDRIVELSNAYDRLFFSSAVMARAELDEFIRINHINAARAEELRSLLQLTQLEERRRALHTDAAGNVAIPMTASTVLVRPQPPMIGQLFRPERTPAEEEANRKQLANSAREVQEMERELEQATTHMQKAMEQAFVGIAESLGKAVVNVRDGLRSLLSGLVGAAAAMSKSLGEMVMKAGLTAQSFGFLGAALKFFQSNPFAAIAIGAAMIALGSALGAAEQNIAAGGSAVGASSAATASAAIQGNMTVVFPSGSVFDPSNPNQVDAFVKMLQAAQGRNIIIQRGG